MEQKKFRPGVRVSVTDDTLSGTVISVEDNMVTFEDEEGFSYTYPMEELTVEIPIVVTGNPLPKDQPAKKPKSRGKKIPAIDLHTEKLNVRTSHLPPGEILQEQLYYFKRFLREARQKHWKKILIIHGVGTGKLRSEVQKILQKQGWIYYEAPYHTYGQGALIAEKR